MAAPNKKTTGGFEKDLGKLEEIVAALEEGGLSLDESLKQFESGIKLARRCEKALSDAEKKIELLMKNAEGELETQPFDAGGGEEKANTGNPKEAGADAPPETDFEDEDEEEGELLF